MEKINREILISSLFEIGFDKVDVLLYIYTLGQLSLDNSNLQLFEFEKLETNQFSDYIYCDDTVYKLKDRTNLKMHTNKKLIEYLSQLDFRKIIIKKIETLGFDKIDRYDLLFSNKEKEIICEMFGIHRKIENNIDKEKTQRDIYTESFEIEKIIDDMQKRKMKSKKIS